MPLQATILSWSIDHALIKIKSQSYCCIHPNPKRRRWSNSVRDEPLFTKFALKCILSHHQHWALRNGNGEAAAGPLCTVNQLVCGGAFPEFPQPGFIESHGSIRYRNRQDKDLTVVKVHEAVMPVPKHQNPLTTQTGTANAEDKRRAFGGRNLGLVGSFGEWWLKQRSRGLTCETYFDAAFLFVCTRDITEIDRRLACWIPNATNPPTYVCCVLLELGWVKSFIEGLGDFLLKRKDNPLDQSSDLACLKYLTCPQFVADADVEVCLGDQKFDGFQRPWFGDRQILLFIKNHSGCLARTLCLLVEPRHYSIG